jgi:protein-ribulosamine 3-kinase
MAPKLDPAIVKALSLDVAVSSIASHGGSGFSSTAKLTTQIHREEKIYFIKTGNGQDAQTMFAGEYSVLIARCLRDS